MPGGQFKFFDPAKITWNSVNCVRHSPFYLIKIYLDHRARQQNDMIDCICPMVCCCVNNMPKQQRQCKMANNQMCLTIWQIQAFISHQLSRSPPRYSSYGFYISALETLGMYQGIIPAIGTSERVNRGLIKNTTTGNPLIYKMIVMCKDWNVFGRYQIKIAAVRTFSN